MCQRKNRDDAAQRVTNLIEGGSGGSSGWKIIGRT